MKQQINPIVAVIGGVIAVAVIGLIFYFINNRTAPPEAPRTVAGQPKPITGVAPDEQIKMRMQQMQSGGAGGQ